MFNIIPAIDLINGRVVRLRQGNYNDVTQYTLSPTDYAKHFQDAGAKRIHIVDLDGAKSGSTENKSTIQAIRKAVDIEIEVGGGIRSLETAQNYFNSGINYIILGSMLINNFELAASIIHNFPNQVIAGIDTMNNQAATVGWTHQSGIDIADIINQINPLPIESIIHTDISKDGMMAGPNINSLKHILNLTHHHIIVSGGVRNESDIQDIRQFSKSGCSGCIIGKAVLSETLCLKTIFKGG